MVYNTIWILSLWIISKYDNRMFYADGISKTKTSLGSKNKIHQNHSYKPHVTQLVAVFSGIKKDQVSQYWIRLGWKNKNKLWLDENSLLAFVIIRTVIIPNLTNHDSFSLLPTRNKNRKRKKYSKEDSKEVLYAFFYTINKSSGRSTA